MNNFGYQSIKYKLIDTFVIKSWWMYLVILLSFLCFDISIKKKYKNIAKYQKQVFSLEANKAYAINAKEDLQLRLNSQSDPEWIEMVLMNQLGVVPEGKIKIHFSK
jgi:hypothetical protein